MTDMSGRLDKEIRELNGRMLNIEHQLGLILKAITTPSVPVATDSGAPNVSPPVTSHTVLSDSSTGAFTDDVDMNHPEVAYNEDVIPSTPPHVSPPTPKEQTLSPDTPLIRHRHAAPSNAVAPYSVNAARTHLTGVTSFSKNDPQRDNSGNSVRDELTHKGKAIQRRENGDFQELQDQIEKLKAANAALVVEGEEKEAALVQIQEQFAVLEEQERQRQHPNYNSTSSFHDSQYYAGPNSEGSEGSHTDSDI
jgi:hypothetical protein